MKKEKKGGEKNENEKEGKPGLFHGRPGINPPCSQTVNPPRDLCHPMAPRLPGAGPREAGPP